MDESGEPTAGGGEIAGENKDDAKREEEAEEEETRSVVCAGFRVVCFTEKENCVSSCCNASWSAGACAASGCVSLGEEARLGERETCTAQS